MAKVSPGEFINQVRAEARKVVWPTMKETRITAIMVVIMTTLLALFFFTGPVVTHALSQACLHENIKPILAEDRRGADRPHREGPAGSGGEGRRS